MTSSPSTLEDELFCWLQASLKQNQWLSQTFCGWMGLNPCSQVPQSCVQLSQALHSSTFMPMVLEGHVQQSYLTVMSGYPHTFGQLGYTSLLVSSSSPQPYWRQKTGAETVDRRHFAISGLSMILNDTITQGRYSHFIWAHMHSEMMTSWCVHEAGRSD